ncbi:hypothetical protein BAUCODRAFT_374634 [Baudoinia panamericana UAMH 10762]|uniref:Uncharacterized protein n=1 Tax=Baudoinia panamericana (strain UAMH 10762) TaxID=717646 RepID=M2N3N7_BAUPA|nr:uncharacterized protein BAUCODRAFT_374634 [Baudoinia panamericana UAMH 10762]EMC98583.1 hypothetical protein BAUCODRAFT_374634 [Baudoinia panamericana UAMH 10762]
MVHCSARMISACVHSRSEVVHRSDLQLAHAAGRTGGIAHSSHAWPPPSHLPLWWTCWRRSLLISYCRY